MLHRLPIQAVGQTWAMAPRRQRLLALLAGLSLAPAGCTPTEPSPRWTRLDSLPTTFTAETLATGAGRMIVAGRSSDPDRPTMLITEAGAVREVRLTPESPYGRTAGLSSVAIKDGQVYALGGDRGGAHANVRWSIWSGTLDAVAEREQSFRSFGGQDAGSLRSIVIGPDGPMIIGNWGSPHGLTITVWTVREGRWTRHDSAGTALASTTAELLSERAAAVTRDRVIIAGTALGLTRGLKPRPAVWTQAAGTSTWHRTDLPLDGTAGSALDLDCADECLVAGVVEGHVAAWSGDGADWRALEPTDLAADDNAVTLKVFRVDAGRRIAVGAGGTVTIMDPATGRTVSAPDGKLIDAAGLGPTASILIEDHDGARSLWQTHLS